VLSFVDVDKLLAACYTKQPGRTPRCSAGTEESIWISLTGQYFLRREVGYRLLVSTFLGEKRSKTNFTMFAEYQTIRITISNMCFYSIAKTKVFGGILRLSFF